MRYTQWRNEGRQHKEINKLTEREKVSKGESGMLCEHLTAYYLIIAAPGGCCCNRIHNRHSLRVHSFFKYLFSLPVLMWSCPMMQHVSPAPAVTMMATQSVPPPSYQESQQVKEVHWRLPHGFCCAVCFLHFPSCLQCYLFVQKCSCELFNFGNKR